jgi:hypothetical protein
VFVVIIQMQVKIVPGSSVVLTNIVEQFSSSHAAAVEQISKLSLVPSNFNPSSDETRRAKSRPTTFTVSSSVRK